MKGRTKRLLGVVGLGLLATTACGKSELTPRASSEAAGAPSAGASVDNVAGATTAGQAGTGQAVGGAGGGPVMSPQNDAGMGGDAPIVTHPLAPSYPGYTLVLEEHFDEPLDLNNDPVWTWSDGASNLHQARFVEEAISFSDGKMVLTTTRPETPVPAGPSFAANEPEVKSKPLTSGELRTKFNNYRYGRYEAAIKAPIPVPGARSKGNFITSFGTSRTPFQDDYREIMFDLYGGQLDGVFAFVVSGDSIDSFGTKNHGEQPMLASGFDTAGGFHVYAIVWTAGSITWLIDDAVVATWLAPMPNSGTVPIPELSAKLLLSTWVFNESYAFGGPEGEANVYPFTTEVDFIRFYKQDGEVYPCDAPPACLPADDLNASKNNPKETDTQG